MKAQYKTLGGRLLVELPESEGVKGIYQSIAEIDEVFDAVKECGACGGTQVQLRVRTVDDNKYFEAQCQTQGCRAKLEFGQTKIGHALFPKRKSREGEWLPHRGWTIWKAAAQAASDADEGLPF